MRSSTQQSLLESMLRSEMLPPAIPSCCSSEVRAPQLPRICWRMRAQTMYMPASGSSCRLLAQPGGGGSGSDAAELQVESDARSEAERSSGELQAERSSGELQVKRSRGGAAGGARYQKAGSDTLEISETDSSGTALALTEAAESALETETVARWRWRRGS